MSSFEWMELQTLASDITNSRSRLAMARSRGDQRTARALEAEITAAEARRAKLLANITSDLSTHNDAAPPQEAEAAGDDETLVLTRVIGDDAETIIEVADIAAEQKRSVTDETAEAATDDTAESAPDEKADPPEPEIADPSETAAIAAIASAMEAATADAEGDKPVWDNLTPGDLERAKDELDARRAEMIARHAEELKDLNAEHERLDALEEAIDAFMRRFDLASGGSVVQLDEQRETRLQSAG